MIAGLPKSPNYYSSSVNEATARKNVVVGQMEKYGYITPSQAEEAKKSSLDIKQKIDKQYNRRNGILHRLCYSGNSTKVRWRRALQRWLEDLHDSWYG